MLCSAPNNVPVVNVTVRLVLCSSFCIVLSHAYDFRRFCSSGVFRSFVRSLDRRREWIHVVFVCVCMRYTDLNPKVDEKDYLQCNIWGKKMIMRNTRK